MKLQNETLPLVESWPEFTEKVFISSNQLTIDACACPRYYVFVQLEMSGIKYSELLHKSEQALLTNITIWKLNEEIKLFHLVLYLCHNKEEYKLFINMLECLEDGDVKVTNDFSKDHIPIDSNILERLQKSYSVEVSQNL
jgi:hypothetical protein